MHLLGVDQVVVVEDQHHLVLAGPDGQLVDQRRHQPLKRRRRRRPEQRADPLGDSWPCPVQRGNRVPPEPCRVVVGCLQRQPDHLPLAAPGPVGQQRRLAEPGRGANQDQPPRQPLIERLRQPRARHETPLRAGHVQLGGQQHIRPGRGNPGRGRYRRLSHRRPTPQRVQQWPASLLDADILTADRRPRRHCRARHLAGRFHPHGHRRVTPRPGGRS